MKKAIKNKSIKSESRLLTFAAVSLLVLLILSVALWRDAEAGSFSDIVNIIVSVSGMTFAIGAVIANKGVLRRVFLSILALLFLYIGIVAVIRVGLSGIGFLG